MNSIAKLMSKFPRECKFKIPMVADSTNEVWVDIPTLLSGNDAWHIVALEMSWETIIPTVPLVGHSSANTQHVLQIHRNTENELLLNRHDDDLLIEVCAIVGSGPSVEQMPYVRHKEAITTQKKLRAVFRTAADNTYISAATNQLVGCIKYFKISGPNVGHTKLGRLTEF